MHVVGAEVKVLTGFTVVILIRVQQDRVLPVGWPPCMYFTQVPSLHKLIPMQAFQPTRARAWCIKLHDFNFKGAGTECAGQYSIIASVNSRSLHSRKYCCMQI
jgi:hypothetical protein